MRRTTIGQPRKRAIPSLLGNEPNFRPRRYLLTYVARFLKKVQPSDALLKLAISSLDAKAKEKVLDRLSGSSPTEDSELTEANAKSPIADIYDFQNYIASRLKGASFCAWWKDFVQVVIDCHEKELSKANSRKAGANDGSVDRMWRRLRLSRVEQEVIRILSCRDCYPWLENLLDGSSWDVILLISIAISSNPQAVCKAISRQSRLVRLGFIEYRSQANRKNETPALSPSMSEFLSGVNWEENLCQYYSVDSGRTFDLWSFPVSARTTEVLQSLLGSTTPAHILLHGIPGTGKTEYARSLVSSLQKRALIIKHGKEGKLAERRLALQLATAFADRRTDVLVVDEADMLLNTGYRLFGQQSEIDKGWINDFIDATPAKVIWITNEIAYVDESLLRRFSYNVRFDVPGRSKRQEIWTREINAHRLAGKVSATVADSLAVKYQLTPAAISSALCTLRRLIREKALRNAEIPKALDEIFRTRQALLHRSAFRAGAAVTDEYALEALHTDPDLESVVSLVARFFETDAGSFGVNILFWGLPGTGKTEFARYLAAKVGVDLMDRKASELLNCFVGETEKNIRRAFAEAEHQRAILFLDEADSFLREREAALHSWEMTQVNELLTNMETHRAVLICSTNLIDCLDRAALRRFAFKVQFKSLTGHGRLVIYRKYFPHCYESLTEGERVYLLRLPDPTLGDFKAVWTKLCLLREEPRSNMIVLQALREESSYRTRRAGEIGFHQDQLPSEKEVG